MANFNVLTKRFAEVSEFWRNLGGVLRSTKQRDCHLHETKPVPLHNLHVALVRRTDGMQFSDQIEALINRKKASNNYTNSSVAAGAIVDFSAQVLRYYSYAVFAWDKNKYHGLVGYVALENYAWIDDLGDPDRKRFKLLHFVFSNGIAGMSIERWVLAKTMERFPQLDKTNIPVQPLNVDWIQGEEFSDPAVKDLIWEKEKNKSRSDIKLRVMAACQSGALAHYSGLSAVAEFDNLDSRTFTLREFEGDAWQSKQYPDRLVYAVFEHFEVPGLETGSLLHYEKCARNFCEFLKAGNKKVLVLLTAENHTTRKEREDAPYQQALAALPRCNNVWRALAQQYDVISILEAGAIAAEGEIIDLYHFDVPLLKQLGDHIRGWYDRETATQK